VAREIIVEALETSVRACDIVGTSSM
jgi:hypothetical protein